MYLSTRYYILAKDLKTKAMKTQHTQGEWKTSANCDFVWVDRDGGFSICKMADLGQTTVANANLIAEAGTVANETGHTPRQLADQKADLLEAAMIAKEVYEELADTKLVDESTYGYHKIGKLCSAIKKATE